MFVNWAIYVREEGQSLSLLTDRSISASRVKTLGLDCRLLDDYNHAWIACLINFIAKKNTKQHVSYIGIVEFPVV